MTCSTSNHWHDFISARQRTSSAEAPTRRLMMITARDRHSTSDNHSKTAPIVVGIDKSRAAAAAARDAVRLAHELAAPLVFLYVRRGPSSGLGEPYHQRRLDAEMRAGRRALSDAMAHAERAGVPATGEQLAGDPAERVVEFARLRGAQLVVLGSRRRRLGRSVSRAVIRSADRPVLVSGHTAAAVA
jgi:nucleotide-binding universal stress UspA family protein